MNNLEERLKNIDKLLKDKKVDVYKPDNKTTSSLTLQGKPLSKLNKERTGHAINTSLAQNSIQNTNTSKIISDESHQKSNQNAVNFQGHSFQYSNGQAVNKPVMQTIAISNIDQIPTFEQPQFQSTGVGQQPGLQQQGLDKTQLQQQLTLLQQQQQSLLQQNITHNVQKVSLPTSKQDKQSLIEKEKKKLEKQKLKEKKLLEKEKKKKTLRKIAGEIWNDNTLNDWADNDYRLFCGDLGNEVSDEVLASAFRKYASFQKARVVRDKRSGKTKGFGFVSLLDPQDFLKALKEMNGKYVGNRPIKVRKSEWQDRALYSDTNKSFEQATFKKVKKK